MYHHHAYNEFNYVRNPPVAAWLHIEEIASFSKIPRYPGGAIRRTKFKVGSLGYFVLWLKEVTKK